MFFALRTKCAPANALSFLTLSSTKYLLLQTKLSFRAPKRIVTRLLRIALLVQKAKKRSRFLLLLYGRELPFLDLHAREKGKFEKALETEDAETFGFLYSKSEAHNAQNFGVVASESALPLLVIWTHDSGSDFTARVFHFYAGKYDSAGGWEEHYEYADEDSDDICFHEVPQIVSHFPFGAPLPD